MFDMRNGFSRTQSHNIFAKLSSDHSFFGKSNSKSKSDMLNYPPSFTIKHGCELCLGFSVPTNFLKVERLLKGYYGWVICVVRVVSVRCLDSGSVICIANCVGI